ncbi:MAG: pilus assembly protein PilM [Candidatus Riflebacteria bacterium]|nr:pilus assembly protein PilM [Candidatus Riflebacteria bacterium]
MSFFTQFNVLDIGTHSLKFFSLDSGKYNQGYKIRDCFSENVSSGLIGGGFTNPKISDLYKFQNLLEQGFSKVSRFREGFFIAIPDRWVKFQMLETELSDEEIASSEYLLWKLKKKLMPAPLQFDCVVDYQIFSITESNGKKTAKIMAGLIHKDIIEVLSTVFCRLRVEVISFDSSTMGIYNLIEEMHPDMSIDRNLIVCHIGHETTNIKIYVKGLLDYERVIEVGGEYFGKKISELENISYSEALKIKETTKYFPVTGREILSAVMRKGIIEKIFGNWLRELQVTFKFYQDRTRISKLPQIFLSGGSSQFYGLPEFLSEYFETPCTLFNPFRGLPLDKNLSEDILQMGPMFAPSLGILVT